MLGATIQRSSREQFEPEISFIKSKENVISY